VSSSDDGVSEDEEFSGAGDEGELVGFSGICESFVESFELLVPVEGSGEGCVVEGFSQAVSSDFDVAVRGAHSRAALTDSQGWVFGTRRLHALVQFIDRPVQAFTALWPIDRNH
jgi:hypothetical protein